MSNLLPQMSPMWWTSLMFSFIILFLVIISMLYFNYSNKMEKIIQLKTNKINWKW